MSKQTLYDRGCLLVYGFCALNELPVPEFRPVESKDWRFSVCAYYRPTYISICLAKCSAIGLGAMAWSYPGYTADRTPYGVLAHELGHHVDVHCSKQAGPYYGDYSTQVRQRSQNEERLTSYCPNDAEWFAEMFRLFLTNPDMLSLIRPRTYSILRTKFAPVVHAKWREVLRDAPARTLAAAERKVNA